MDKVFGLVRVSSVSQSDNTSIQHQKDTIEKYCDLYNLPLVEIVEEVYSELINEPPPPPPMHIKMSSLIVWACQTKLPLLISNALIVSFPSPG